MKKKQQLARGVTLMVILIAMGILLLIGASLWRIQKNFSSSNTYLTDSLNAQGEARGMLKILSAEVRSLSPSSNGTYPIEQASSTSLVFYSDIDNDTLKERVHYYLDGSVVRKGTVKPTGAPLSYNLGTETLKEVMHDVINGTTTPLFNFYDSTYAGTSSPLGEPVVSADIRLVQITIIVDKDPDKPPTPLTFSTAV